VTFFCASHKTDVAARPCRIGQRACSMWGVLKIATSQITDSRNDGSRSIAGRR
jgi:hypothetical protein